MVFENKVLPTRKIKINRKVKEAIGAYKKKNVPMRALLTDYLAVKSKGDALADAENPWAYFYKGIKEHNVETGVSVDETLFRFAAMELKEQDPTDVINAAFYANKYRNDYDFELGYLLPVFWSMVDKYSNLLIVNPSPDVVSEIENSEHLGNRFYATTDDTIAQLYKIQFPEGTFVTLDKLVSLPKVVDAVLVINRDLRTNQATILLKSLLCCRDGASVIGLVPSVWFDEPMLRAYESVKNAGFFVKQLLIVDPSATVTTPRKKIITLLDKKSCPTITVFHSTYNAVTKEFKISTGASINAENYLTSRKTILSSWREAITPVDTIAEPKYRKAKQYRFSNEISLFYRLYAERKERYAGVVHYRNIKHADTGGWGRKISPEIEKGLRAKSEALVIASIENIPFDPRMYPIIRSDLELNYLYQKRKVSLKTIWFYCWTSLKEATKYDHVYVSKNLFNGSILSDCFPQTLPGHDLMEIIANHFNVDWEDIPYKAVEQIHLILDSALKSKIIDHNSLIPFVADFTSRASERQQDVRNALVKKRFSHVEEMRIFEQIVQPMRVNGKEMRRCTVVSLILATAIRLFTGLSIREVAALKWSDYRNFGGQGFYQIIITKFVDSKGTITHMADKEQWQRFRLVPVPVVLSYLLNERKQYLLDCGVSEAHLSEYPVILSEERISDMKTMKNVKHCKPATISKSSNNLISKANIQQNLVVLPDDRNDLVTDFNKYHGDIFLSNYRHKANHLAFMAIGEINYVIGIKPPDTLSDHYIDYTNDFLQTGMIVKLRRWGLVYERMICNPRMDEPACGTAKGDFYLEVGPFELGVAGVDLIINNKTGAAVTICASAEHGLYIDKTEY